MVHAHLIGCVAHAVADVVSHRAFSDVFNRRANRFSVGVRRTLLHALLHLVAGQPTNGGAHNLGAGVAAVPAQFIAENTACNRADGRAGESVGIFDRLLPRNGCVVTRLTWCCYLLDERCDLHDLRILLL